MIRSELASDIQSIQRSTRKQWRKQVKGESEVLKEVAAPCQDGVWKPGLGQSTVDNVPH